MVRLVAPWRSLRFSFFGFDPQADPLLGRTAQGNSSSSLRWLALLYAIIPAGSKFVSLPVIWRYPLTEARHQRIRERIERRGVSISAKQRTSDVEWGTSGGQVMNWFGA